MSSRAIETALLEQRIAENKSSQGIDLATWIFERLVVRPQVQILELCCGTGAQSLRLLESLGNSGALSVVDVSADSLNVLASRVPEQWKKKLRLIEANIDELPSKVPRGYLREPAFDLIFCAYGLYYSTDARKLLAAISSWLKPGGRIAIVGPFGPNNRQLFELIQASGVVLPDAVVDSSQRFMLETVVPWAAANFESVNLQTMVNPVLWTAPERVLNYWQNTTF